MVYVPELFPDKGVEVLLETGSPFCWGWSDTPAWGGDDRKLSPWEETGR